LIPFLNGSGSTPFGDYDLIEEIARGGMGVVFKARQRSLNRIVAVKVILGGRFAGKQLIQRFRGEVMAAALLQHPNIVAVLEVGMHQGQHFFSMNYVEGQNLAELLGNRPLPSQKAARYMQKIAEAIQYAHSQGILHRDLKPSNVLIDSATDQPRVTDFGLAKHIHGESSLTLTGQVLGSPNFMPPEQASGNRGKVGKPSDVYGLGAILYYLLTARAPCQAESLEGIVTEVLQTETVSPRLLTPGVPADLETICLKCLEKEPARRYQTAQELADELGRFLQDKPIHARPVTSVARLWRRCRRNPALASLSAAIVVLGLVFAIGGPIAFYRIEHEKDRAERESALRRVQLYATQVNLAGAALANDDLNYARDLLMGQWPGKSSTNDLRGFEWRYFYGQCRSEESALLGRLFPCSCGHSACFMGRQWDGQTLGLPGPQTHSGPA
jgi:eukaryotic-like serine/threonine-protein kinase